MDRSTRDLLEECFKQFTYYAANHRDKNTLEALDKAFVNERLAFRIREHLDMPEAIKDAPSR